jgi:large subunit ribosomal protein L4
MTIDTWTLAGIKSEKITLPEAVFGVKVDKKLLAQAVRVFLSNQRKSHAKTKTRGEIAKTTAKMYKQKGTGRARHGSYSAPIFVGGGISHGPDGTQNYKLSMPSAMKKLALIEALSAKASDKKISAVTGADKASGKTQEIANLVKKAGWKGSTLVIGSKDQKMWLRGWKNIDKVIVRTVNQVNTYIVLANRQLIVTTEAIKDMSKTYVN